MGSRKNPERLVLVVRREVFAAIKSGRRKWHHWVDTPYWRRRVEGDFKIIEVRQHTMFGKRDPRSLVLPWRGFVAKKVIDREISSSPVNVIAIDLRGAQESLFEEVQGNENA